MLKRTLTLVLVSSVVAHAQLPSETLSFSAVLTDAIGDPAIGPVSVEFKIYDSMMGGALLWQEIQAGLPVDTRGRLKVKLGAVTPLLTPVFASADRWLTMNVNGDGEMSPRMPLSTVPHAHNAALLDGSPPSSPSPAPAVAPAASSMSSSPSSLSPSMVSPPPLPAGAGGGTGAGGGAGAGAGAAAAARSARSPRPAEASSSRGKNALPPSAACQMLSSYLVFAWVCTKRGCDLLGGPAPQAR